MYAWWCFAGLKDQGLYHDVALLGVEALRIDGPPYESPLHARVGGATLPLMFNPYNGAMEVYLAALPAVRLGGHTALALNAASVAWGLVMLLAGALVSAVYYRTAWAAAGFVALLGLSPSYIAATRIGLYAGTVHGGLVALALLSFCLWARPKGRVAYLIAGFFLLGLGMGSRTLVLWYAAGLAAALYATPSLRRRFLSLKPPVLWTCAGALSVGMLPVLYANAAGDWFSFRFLSQFAVRSRSGVDNAAYLTNILERLRELGSMWSATAWLWPETRNVWAVVLLAASAGLVLWLRRARPAKEEGSDGFAPLIVVAVALLLSPFTPTFLDVHHLFPTYPFAALVMLAPLCAPFPRHWSKTVRGAAWVLFAGCLLQDALMLNRSAPHTTLHGGHEVHWNVLSGVVDWTRREGVKTLGLGDTGIMDPLLYLSGLEADAEEYFAAPYLSAEQIASRQERLRRVFREQRSSYFLFREESAARVPYFPEFARLASEERVRLRPAASFATPAGDPLFVIYRAERRR